MQTPIKWNDYVPGMKGLAILRRELPQNSNGLSPSGVYTITQEKSQPKGRREYASVPDPFSRPLSRMTLKHLIEQLSMMCSPDHPSRTVFHQFLPSDGVLVTCTYKQVPKLALSPPL